jgi:hypothetical protein
MTLSAAQTSAAETALGNGGSFKAGESRRIASSNLWATSARVTGERGEVGDGDQFAVVGFVFEAKDKINVANCSSFDSSAIVAIAAIPSATRR